ncbi:MAG TPA: DMT family transporter [Stellaceae bacterium]|jgi:drug/metabolite transporter (DMT)-like permease
MAATGPALNIDAASVGPLRTWKAALAAVAGSVMVGFMPIMTLQLYKAGISAPSMLVWRYGLALVPLTAASAVMGHDFGLALRQGAWRIALVGATLGAGQTLCFWESLHTLDTSIAVLLFYTYPALTLVLDRLVFKRPIRGRAALCVALILIGAGLITVPGLRGGGLDPRGLMWILPSPVIYALYLAANSVLMRRHPPLVGAAFLYLGLLASFAGASLSLGLDVPAAPHTWLLILIIALGPGALTVTLFSYSVPRLGPASYAVIANCELVTVILIGVLGLDEKLTVARAIGAALVLGGIVLHGLFRRPKTS